MQRGAQRRRWRRHRFGGGGAKGEEEEVSAHGSWEEPGQLAESDSDGAQMSGFVRCSG